jgi:hypothetical protein
MNLDHRGSKKNLTINRRYLDPNRVTYEVCNHSHRRRFVNIYRRQYHTHRHRSSFDTFLGRRITAGLKSLATKFDLSFKFGTAPRDYSISRDAYPSDGSVLSLLVDEVLPTVLVINNTRASIPHLIIANSGAIRFDVFAGPFTKNDQLTASPFTDGFDYIADVPLGVANKVLPVLNKQGETIRRDLDGERYARGDVGTQYRLWLEDMHLRAEPERLAAPNLTLGYVTKDVGRPTLF